MKQVKVRVSRVAGMAVLLAVITGVTPILSTVTLFGRGVMPAQAAEVTKWVLQDKETRIPLDTFQKDVPQSDGGLVKYSIVRIGTTLSYQTQVIKGGKITFNSTYTFTFAPPPNELTPGQSVELSIQGRGTGNISSMPAHYTYHADYVENFRPQNADQIATLRINATSPNLSGVLRFTVPPTPPTGMGGQITLTAEIPAIQNVVGTPGQFVWIYRAPEETPPGQEKLTLKYYPPFDYFKERTGTEIAPAGDLVAMLENYEHHTTEKGPAIVFYVDQETPADYETGKNLYEVVVGHSYREDRWWGGIRLTDPKDRVDNRKYLSWILADAIDVKQQGGWSRNGTWEARIFLPGWIDPEAFARELITEKAWAGDKGKISGTVWAGVFDGRGLTPLASYNVEFNVLAKVLYIGGTGRNDEFKAAYVKEDPDHIPWGPGRVRVRRPLVQPRFDDYRELKEGDLLMPGDIVDIDANAELEIAWVNGAKAIARVPDKKNTGDATGGKGELNTHYALVMAASASDSGFTTAMDALNPRFVFGFMHGKGIDFILDLLPQGADIKDFLVEVYDSTKNIDWSKLNVITKIRVRSKVIIDNNGDELKVYNIEGSPIVETAAGGEVTLANGQMVAVSDDGKLGSPQTFNVKAVEGEFYNNAGISGSPSPAKSNSSVLPYALGAAALFVVALVVFGILRRRRNG
ncbi:MAG: hypothetical protein Q7J73_11070 [Dehalococcoidales bacterium]|nr:hypothetical protein [Dehalococcoidales bacterium]